MPAFKPMKPENVDIEKIKFSLPKTNDNGGKMIYINYDNNGLYLQTPLFSLPYDCGTYYEDKPGCGKYQVRVSLKGHEDDEQIKAFHDMMCNFDEMVKKSAKENSLQWFKKKNMSKETINELYNSTVRVSTDKETGEPDGKYPPSFTCKIQKWEENIKCRCFDSNKEEFNINFPDQDNFKDLEKMFTRGTKIRMILKCKFIWVASGKFGVSWGVEHCKIIPAPSFDDYAFLDDSDEDSNDKNDKNDKNDRQIENSNGNFIDDSSDED